MPSLSLATLMALRKEKLGQFKKLLLSRREELAKDLSQATASMIDDDATFSDAVDQASADVDRSLNATMKNRERDILWQIDEALARIEAGTFGECVQCEEEISEARMRAYPATSLCIDCQAELESGKLRYDTQRYTQANS